MGDKRTISIARGDGIGPEITEAVLAVLEAAGAALDYQEVVLGQAAVDAGEPSGLPEAAIQSIQETGILLKAPLRTPQGGGYSSVNVALRKHFGLYANVRPCRAYAPYVATQHPGMDLVIIRENEEDLYIGREYPQTPNVVQAAKVISRTGSERIVRYAFEYAKAHKRTKVSCLTKDNILKKSDGLFREIFERIAQEYPDIQAEHLIVDIGMARVAHTPNAFDVIVLPNLYGDILSDITSELTGSVGLGGSANIGKHVAMFEAVHGCAPDLAGEDCANPSGLLLAAIQLLHHIGQHSTAQTICNAWLVTLESGEHTLDLYQPDTSIEQLGTQAFAQAIISHLGHTPKTLPCSDTQAIPALELTEPALPRAALTLRGVDIFMHWEGFQAPDQLKELQQLDAPEWKLSYVEGRGICVFPNTTRWPEGCDYWLCRFEPKPGHACDHAAIARLLTLLSRFGRGCFTQVQLLQA